MDDVAEPAPVACTLTAKQAADQVHEWAELVPRATSQVELADGAEMRFGRGLETVVRDIAERESRCCAFLNIDVVLDNREVVLRVTADSDDGVSVVRLLTRAVEH